MKRLVFALVLVSLFSTTAFAKDIVLGQRESTNPTGVFLKADEVLNAETPAMKLSVHVDKLVAENLKTPKGEFTHLAIPGFQHSGEIGAPSIPVMNKLLEVPFGAKVEVKVLKKDETVVELNKHGFMKPLFPRQPPQPKSGPELAFEYDRSAYQTKGFQQDVIAKVIEVGTMRHVRLVMVQVSPVGYDASSNKVIIAHDVELEVTLQGADMARTAEIKRLHGSRAFNGVYARALSPASLRNLNAAAPNRAATYLIVSHRMFEEDLAPFVAWKKQKGFKIIEAYTDTIGETTEEIKTYIHGLYNNATEAAPAPEFVLFVGDVEQVPNFRGTTGSHISDQYYVAVTEGDLLPEMQTGRFSAQNSAELNAQIAKTLEYEKYAFADPSFLERVVMVAGWDYSHAVKWGWPQLKYGLKYYYNAEHGMPEQAVYLSAGSHQNETDIKASVAKGCTFLNYTAHGSSTSWADPSFSKTDISNLTNAGMYPLVIGNCCLTNKFEVATCFGEAWLRAENKGAIGYIGGTNSTYWDEDLWWGAGFYPIAQTNPNGDCPDISETGIGAYDGSFEHGYATQYGFMLAGNLAVQESNSPRKAYYWEIYQLMGDPALMPYWGKPAEMVVKHEATVAANAETLAIEAPAGAYVGITLNGELVAAGYADAGNKAVLAAANLSAGEAQVVVTGQNLKPYFGTITVE